jgi:hypothetical protein
MKVDIWIYTDDGGEQHLIGANFGAALAHLMDARIYEQLHCPKSGLSVYEIIEEILEDKNESNKN